MLADLVLKLVKKEKANIGLSVKGKRILPAPAVLSLKND